MVGAFAALATIPNSSQPKPGEVPVHEQRLLALTAGSVKQIVANEGQVVEAGEDIVMLDDAKEQEALIIAQAELQKLSSEARESGIAVTLPGPPAGLGGTIVQTGPMQVRPNFTPGKPSKKVDPLPAIEGSDAAPGAEPKADPKAIEKLRTEAKNKEASLRADAERYDKDIEDAKLELEEAQRAQETARIIADRAKLASDRAKTLLAQGAISLNENARLDGQTRLQQSVYDNSTKKVEEVQAKIATLTAERDKALDKASRVGEDLKEAEAQAVPKISQAKPSTKSLPDVRSAPTPRYSKPAVIIPHRPEASTAPAKVEIDKGAKIETDEKLKQAKIKLDEAESAVMAKRITAQRRMRIVRWLIKPSDALTPSTPVAVVEFLPEPKKPAAPVPAPDPNPEKALKPEDLQKKTGLSDNTR